MSNARSEQSVEVSFALAGRVVWLEEVTGGGRTGWREVLGVGASGEGSQQGLTMDAISRVPAGGRAVTGRGLGD